MRNTTPCLWVHGFRFTWHFYVTLVSIYPSTATHGLDLVTTVKWLFAGASIFDPDWLGYGDRNGFKIQNKTNKDHLPEAVFFILHPCISFHHTPVHSGRTTQLFFLTLSPNASPKKKRARYSASSSDSN
jgi:hypothetical protein